MDAHNMLINEDSFNNKKDKIELIHRSIDNLYNNNFFMDEIENSYAYNESKTQTVILEEETQISDQTNGFNLNQKSKLRSYKDIITSAKDFSFKSLTLNEAIELYKLVGSRNADFLFNWLYDVYKKTFLPSIDPIFKDTLTLDKTKLTIFDVLIDDLADDVKLRSKRLLEESVEIPWHGSKKYNDPYLEITKQIWLDCINSIKLYPRYNEFEDLFNFDLRQVMNSMRYSLLVNTSNVSNLTEDKIYLHHGVMVILHCDMDLMCSPFFNYEELENLRPILYMVQDVAHIANMLNTYTKEIEELDFSSPIISLGLRKGLISKKMIIRSPDLARKRLMSQIPFFERRLKNNLNQIKKHANEIESIDLNAFYNQLKNVWEEFLKRREYWKELEPSSNKKE